MIFINDITPPCYMLSITPPCLETGISEANQKKLFHGVVQFDPEKNQGGGGSGFGLFISKGIVDLHKGTIAVHSEGEGHGCSFILSMPMMQAEVDPTLAKSENAMKLIAIDARSPPTANRQETIDALNASSKSLNHPGLGNIMLKTTGSGNSLMTSEKDIGNKSNHNWLSMNISGKRLTTNNIKAEISHMAMSRKKYRLLIVDDRYKL